MSTVLIVVVPLPGYAPIQAHWGSILESGRSHGDLLTLISFSLLYSCLEIPMDRVLKATVHGVTKVSEVRPDSVTKQQQSRIPYMLKVDVGRAFPLTVPNHAWF